MNIKTMTVNLGCKLSPRNYNNIEAHVSVTAELSEDDDVNEVSFALHVAAHTALVGSVGILVSALSPYEREAALVMLGIAPDDDDDNGGGEDDYESPDDEPEGELETDGEKIHEPFF